MIINGVLAALFIFVAVALFVIEAIAVVTKQPTISERIQNMDKSARFVGIIVTFVATFFLFHFFGN